LVYQTIELSSSYTPEVSKYKEAAVLAVDRYNGTVTLSMDPETVHNGLLEPDPDSVFGSTVSDRFELYTGDEEGEEDGQIAEDENGASCGVDGSKEDQELIVTMPISSLLFTLLLK
jgi:hypothetical protein